jgi:hypothetical protein
MIAGAIAADVLSARAAKVRLGLEAAGLAGLYELLEAAVGATAGDGGRFVVDGLWGSGRQSHVFAGHDRATGEPVVIKQPAFDYREPLRYGRRDAAAMRAPLVQEDEVLRAARARYLCAPVALVRGPAIVPVARDSRVLGAEEVLCIAEWVDATPLADAGHGAWRALSVAARDAAAARLAAEFIAFWDDLRAGGWFYADVNATNLLADRAGRLRVVDAGSAVRGAPEVVLPGVSPAFATPALLSGATEGRPFPGTIATVLPLLGKVLHFALTLRQPCNGEMPDLHDPALDELSRPCREALGALVGLDGHPRDEPAARAAIARWHRHAG